MPEDLLAHHGMEPSFASTAHTGIASKMRGHPIGNVSDENFDLLKKLGNRRVLRAGQRFSRLFLALLQDSRNVLTKRLHLSANSFIARCCLRVALDQLEHK